MVLCLIQQGVGKSGIGKQIEKFTVSGDELAALHEFLQCVHANRIVTVFALPIYGSLLTQANDINFFLLF